ncbi:cell division protease FtsH [Salinibacter ruber]|uniref:ATP-dependent zinc metalloprotease FtsH n=1 Tax=Salinibacter ruber TaxID=146919 RepID=UPI0021691AC5|nr:cell division protease FtsH [Salinibacter ruber]
MADQTSQNDNQNGSGLPGGGPSGTGRGRLIIWVIAGTLLALWAYSYWGMGASGGERISYSEFRTQLQQENVERVEVKGNAINGTLKSQATRSEQGNTVEYQNFVTYLPSFGDEQLMDLLESQGVNVVTKPESSFPWGLVIMGLLPVLLLFGVGYIFLRRMQSQGQGLFSVRQSKAELYDKDEEDTTFDDVAGADSAKEELREIIKFLKNPKRFEGLGGKVPKGVLLVGPPGTGKTLLARAVAGEANAPFFSVSGSDFMEMFVGVGASRVRDMFSEAKETAPAIIFIDELDSIGRKRGAGLGGGNDEREQTLNQLLSELDGFEENEGVIVMAATNRPDILDSALTRPGRFDRQITVDLPTKQSRHEILKIHAREKPLSDDVDLEEIARSTPGFSGADLENLLNEAALLAGRHGHDAIQYSDIEQARDKVMMGLKRDGMVLDDEEKKLLAYHEAGHAIVGAALPNADPVHKVTIVPRGKAMGVTQQLPEKDQYLYRHDYILDRLAVIMGGRAAEELIFDTATSGAENDLKQVRKMARKMVLDWGMGDQFKHISLGEDQGNVFLGDEIAKGREYSDDTAREVDEEIRRISEDAFQRAVDTLNEHHEAFDQLADMLIEQEEVSGKDVLKLMNGDADEIGHAPPTNGAAASEENGSADEHEPDEATVIEDDRESGEGRASGSADASGS